MNRFVALARRLSLLLAPLIAVSATTCVVAAPGSLDTAGFGLGFGKVISAIGTSTDTAFAVLVQPDGKIVVTGTCTNNGEPGFCVARYLPNGLPDSSFDGDGKVLTPIGSPSGTAKAAALQPDGKIVLAGNCWNGNNNDFCLARYLPDGVLDTSFNGNGIVIAPIGPLEDYATAMTLQPDGKLVVVGECYSSSLLNSADFCIARFNPNGALDTSFNTTGKVITPIGNVQDRAFAVTLQPDGRIVVAGLCFANNDDFCLARYLPNGALDTSFDNDGKVITSFSSQNDRAYAVAIQQDGKILAAGSCSVTGNFDFCLARYLANGSLDLGFNGSGMVTTPIGSFADKVNAIALQPDGKIVVAGVCSAGADDFCLARYLPTGALDGSFGGGGKVVTAIGSADDVATAMALQPDGKIVVAGYCNNGSNFDFCVARYEGGPFEARNCTMDVDGDGVMNATTDGLIITRVMLGMTGSAALNGISFAQHATRGTWPLIRDYLVTQCGMSVAP